MARALAHSWPRLAALLLAALLLIGGAIGLRAQTAAEDQGVLAGFLSRLLSTPTSRVTIGTVEGALSSDAVIRDVAIADDRGIFLSIDRIRLVWRRAALLQRRIEVQRLEIGRITLIRRPNAQTGEPEPGPLLPELPLALSVDAFTLGEFVLGEPVLGAEARLSARGAASLGAPSQGLRATLEVRRLDAPGAADLSLSFVPQSQRLELRLAADEPAGGVLARLAQIPGTPPVKVDLAGAGVLDDFTARLAFEGGPEVDARGTARLVRKGAERALTLDLAARVAPLLPFAAQPIFAGVTRLSGDVGFADAGGLALRDLRLAAPLAELSVTGSVAADRRLDVKVSARAVPNDGGATNAGRGRLGRLILDASAQGPFDAPRIAGALDLAELVTSELSLGALTGRFAITPLPSAETRLGFSAEAVARGLVPADEGLDAALGRDLQLTLRGETDAAGVARFDEARIASPNLSLAFTGRLARTLIDGKVGLAVTRLAAFSRLAGLPLEGRATIDATLAGNPSTRAIAATLAGRTEGLRLGDARLERLLGESLTLDGRIAQATDGLTVEALRVTAATAAARLDGRLSSDAVALDAAVDLFDLRTLDPRLAGRASAAARLTGPRADPALTLALSAAEATALGRPVRNFAVSLTASSILSTPRASLSGGGSIGGKPLQLEARVDALTGGGWRTDRLAAALGSVSLTAAGNLSADGLLDGEARLAAGDLDDVAPLALTPLSGRIDAAITARAAEGRQDVTVKASGAGLVVAGFRAGSVRSDITGQDLYRRPVLRGELRATSVTSGSLALETVSLVATDGGAGASAITVDARGGGFTLAGAAQVRPGPPTEILLERFRAARAGRAIALAAPATLQLADGGIRTAGLNLDLAGGRIAISGAAGRLLDLTATLRAVPLAVIDVAAPGLGASGTADGQLILAGTAAAPNGRFDLNLKSVSLAATRDAGLPPLAVTARGTVAPGASRIDARLAGGRAIDLSVTGTVGLAADPRLDLKIAGTLDAALASRRLAPGQRVTGRVALDATVTGTPQRPRLCRSRDIGGRRLHRCAARRGDRRPRGPDRRRRRCDPDRAPDRTSPRRRHAVPLRSCRDRGRRSFPADLRITARAARLLDSGLARLVADADIAVTGPLAARRASQAASRSTRSSCACRSGSAALRRRSTTRGMSRRRRRPAPGWRRPPGPRGPPDAAPRRRFARRSISRSMRRAGSSCGAAASTPSLAAA